jgi:hypothetical protein
MVGKVPTGNGSTRHANGATSLLGGDELSDCGTWPKASVAEPLRDELLQLCRQRLDGFRAQRGEEVYCCAEACGYAHQQRVLLAKRWGCDGDASEGPRYRVNKWSLRPCRHGAW